MLLLPQNCLVVELQKMSRLSLMFLIVTSLALTVYFGSVAWRVSDDGDNDITGHVLTGQGNGWRSTPARLSAAATDRIDAAGWKRGY
jgi:hypothetical protein